MKWIVFSDSHGTARNMEKVLDMHFDTADGFLFLGDGYREFRHLADCYPGRTYLCVRGNCDPAEADAPPLEELADIGGVRIMLTHGHRYQVKSGTEMLVSAARARRADIVLYGHTHEPFQQYLPPEGEGEQPLYVFCPGSITLPRVGHPAYGILEIRANGILLTNAEI